MNHLIRAGLILLLGVASFMALRTLVLQGRVTLSEFALRPPMQARNTADWAALPLQYSDSPSCQREECHQDTYDVWATSAHGSVACETCHGAAQAHVRDSEVSVPVDERGNLCNLCHAQVPGRPAEQPQIDPATHYSETTCTSCHDAHRPGPPRAIPHEVLQGSDCLSCHGPDDPADRAVPATHIGRSNEDCLTCHE